MPTSCRHPRRAPLTRRGRLPVLVALALALPGPTHAQFVAARHAEGGRAALIAIFCREGGWTPPCPEDAHLLRDSMYLRVRTGDAFVPRRSSFALSSLFGVAGVTPDGDVLLEMPRELASAAARGGFGEETLRVSRGGARAQLLADEGGAEFEFRVVDALPPGASLGVPEGPSAVERAWNRPHPAVVDGPLPDPPRGYRGPWGTVYLLVQLDPSGRFVSAHVVRGVNWILDSRALTAVERWKYRLGIPCAGRPPERTIGVEVRFAP